jgi:hypothetical protein
MQVLMFDDNEWVPKDTNAQNARYKEFVSRALAAVKEKGASLVILEGGCGKRVPVS